MSEYWPLILIAALVVIALLWWLLSNKPAPTSAKPSEAPKAIDTVVKAAPEPSVTPSPKAVVAKVAAKKPAATKAPAAKAADKPAAKKVAAPKAAPAKAVTAKVAAPKATPAKAKAAPKAEPKAAAKPKAAVAAKPKAAPKPKAAAKPAPKPVIPDNLELLKGVGPKLNTLLKTLGITSFDQVANWTPADITEIDSKLGTFAGRIGRDNWVDQAKLLVNGDIAGFEKKYGALGSEVQKGQA